MWSVSPSKSYLILDIEPSKAERPSYEVIRGQSLPRIVAFEQISSRQVKLFIGKQLPKFPELQKPTNKRFRGGSAHT